MDTPLFSDPTVLRVSQIRPSKKRRTTKNLIKFTSSATIAGEPPPDQAIPPKKKLRITISEPVLTLFKNIFNLPSTLSNTLSDLKADNPVLPLDPPTDLIVGPINTLAVQDSSEVL